ncbi:unnamed protein product [Musa textilis]
MKRRCLPTPAFRLSEGMSAGKRPTWARGSPHGPSVEVSRGPLNPLVKIPPPASSVRDPDPAGVWDRDPSAAGGLDPTALSDLAPEPLEEIVARPAPSSFLVVDVATSGIMAPSMEPPTEEGPPRVLVTEGSLSLALAGLVYRCPMEGLADLCFLHEVLHYQYMTTLVDRLRDTGALISQLSRANVAL